MNMFQSIESIDFTKKFTIAFYETWWPEFYGPCSTMLGYYENLENNEKYRDPIKRFIVYRKWESYNEEESIQVLEEKAQKINDLRYRLHLEEHVIQLGAVEIYVWPYGGHMLCIPFRHSVALRRFQRLCRARFFNPRTLIQRQILGKSSFSWKKFLRRRVKF